MGARFDDDVHGWRGLTGATIVPRRAPSASANKISVYLRLSELIDGLPIGQWLLQVKWTVREAVCVTTTAKRRRHSPALDPSPAQFPSSILQAAIMQIS